MSLPVQRFLFGIFCALAGGALSAQRPVVTVGGANPSFANLPPAVAAAAPGSIIEVRAGTYTGFSTQKAIRLVLQGATVVAPAGANYAIEIQGVVGSDPFVLKGTNGVVGSGLLGSVRVSNTVAPVVVEDVALVGSGFQAGLDVFSTGSVHVARATLLGNPAIQAQFANLISSDSLVSSPVGSAMIVADSFVDSARSAYLGTGQPAVRLFDCQARLSSDGNAQMLVLGNPVVPVSAIEATACTLYWEPSTFLLAPANGAPPLLSVATTEVLGEVPTMISTSASLGAIARVRMSMSAPTVGLIAVGFLRPAPVLLGPALVYPEVATAVLATAGVADPNGLVVTFTVPSTPALRGEVFCFQGVAFPAGGAMAMSGPALWCLQ